LPQALYSNSISGFLSDPTDKILGILTTRNEFALEQTQRDSWIYEVELLKKILNSFAGQIYFEFSIPRMGQRIDIVLLIGPIIFVIEFKVGERKYNSSDLDQVFDYALDLNNFHETSHNKFISPILVATDARNIYSVISLSSNKDYLINPIKCNAVSLQEVLKSVVSFTDGTNIDAQIWENGKYKPTPTIIEAAKALYKNHSVEEISRSDASAINLKETSSTISRIINYSKQNSKKSICFVTGVPGSGKTLVGLNIATKHYDKNSNMYSVFLSGNGPLVKILREALTRDKVSREKALGNKIKKYEAFSEVKMFVQNVHNFRDDCLVNYDYPPIEHVALFDEAQRAWNKKQTISFMRRKRKLSNFSQSEPEFLVSCLDRHKDWAVIVCLVGGGQEIHTGEAGISEWVNSIRTKFNHWDIYISSRLSDEEYNAKEILKKIESKNNVLYETSLHLSVSMRSFRAEHVSSLVKHILDFDVKESQRILKLINKQYPIVITRDVKKAKNWLKIQARGSERYGLIVSSQAERLKPHAIFVKSEINPIHWFLNGKDDTRSSYYLEDVATEFHIQGLELDWVCVTWDADFRYTDVGWDHWSFIGSKWKKIRKPDRKIYLKNAYRVLLTRARQGMVIVVPFGDKDDPTRNPKYYDPTFNYLRSIGFECID